MRQVATTLPITVSDLGRPFEQDGQAAIPLIDRDGNETVLILGPDQVWPLFVAALEATQLHYPLERMKANEAPTFQVSGYQAGYLMDTGEIFVTLAVGGAAITFSMPQQIASGLAETVSTSLATKSKR